MGEKPIPKVTLVIVNYNGKEDTVEFIKSLQGIEYKNYDIFVTDNNSTDGSIEELKKLSKKDKRIKLFLSKANLCLVGGSNKGVEYAIKKNSDYILFIITSLHMETL